jgi:hypothetical protein
MHTEFDIYVFITYFLIFTRVLIFFSNFQHSSILFLMTVASINSGQHKDQSVEMMMKM